MSGPEADLWVYGRVESAYSPSRRTGLQPLWWTPGVGKKVRTELEKAVQCFHEKWGSRLQFFTLSSGQHVITRTRLSRDREVVDQTGRQTFVCYAWIVEPSHFRLFGDNPFQIAEPFAQLDDISELIERWGPPGSAIEKVSISMRSGSPTRPSLPEEDLAQLERFAFHTGNKKADSFPLALVGDPADAEELMSWVLARIPVAKRSALTFSTQTNECPIPKALFWAIGSTQRRLERAPCEILLGNGVAAGRLEFEESADATRYFRWLDHEGANFVPPVASLEAIAAGLRALDANVSPASGPLDLDGGSNPINNHLASFFEENHEDLMRVTRRRLSPHFGKDAARDLAQRLTNDLEDGRALRLLRMLSSRKVLQEEILEDVEAWLASQWPVLARPTERKLRKAAREHQKWRLEFWLVCRGPFYSRLPKSVAERASTEDIDKIFEPVDNMSRAERKRFDKLIKKCPTLLREVKNRK